MVPLRVNLTNSTLPYPPLRANPNSTLDWDAFDSAFDSLEKGLHVLLFVYFVCAVLFFIVVYQHAAAARRIHLMQRLERVQ